MALIECEDCGNHVSERAASCPHCGGPIYGAPAQSMEDVRTGASQAALNQELSGFFIFQILVVSIFTGLYFSSWWAGVGALVVLMIFAPVRIIGMLIGLVLAVGTGLAAYFLGSLYDETAGMALGVLFFLIALGSNIAGTEYFKDANKHR